jgi:hypothetical protein
MTPYEAAQRLADEDKRNKRIANWITALVLALVAAAVLIVFFGYHPERANACSPHRNPCKATAAFYDHVADCKLSLRGYYSDDDVHAWGVATGAKSFNGWGASGHYSDGSAYVWGYFEYSYGKVVLYRGRCSDGDYQSDWFSWS